MIHFVLHDPKDTVAVVVVEGVKAGQDLTGWIMDEDRKVSLKAEQDIPIGHKVVTQPIKSMAPIDQAFTKMLNDIVLLIVGGIGGIMSKRAVRSAAEAMAGACRRRGK